MILSYRWLSELVDLGGRSPAELAEAITFHIAEVEGVEAVANDIDDVVVGLVLETKPHPDADRLTVCRVDAGPTGTFTVVCGAPNVAAQQHICYAPVGTTLNTPKGPLTLDEREIRGVSSAGMICAEDELGLGTGHDGIIVLPADTELGVPVADALGVRDHLIEVGNTAITHRPDLWGHVGFARDLGAVLRTEVRYPEVAAAEASLEAASGAPYAIRIDDEAGCRRYVGLVMDGASNGVAPLWMRRRLETLGVRSIDLLVDLTNYVLLEQGQPLHAFDTRALKGDEIVVRQGRADEVLRSLDAVDRPVGPEDIVIADASRPVALAGVMGGADSGMAADTTTLLLEAATFDPVRIRRTSARVGLRTEASARFEKSLDPELCEIAAKRFAELVLAHCPGSRVARPLTDIYPRPYETRVLSLPYALVRRRLGLRIADTRLKKTLTRLGFKVVDDRTALSVTVPSWRATKDVEGVEDLVEEVGRVSGYADLPPVPPVTVVRPTCVPAPRALERRVASVLSLGLGYSEVKGYSFYGAADATLLGIEGVAHTRLSHPLSEQQDRMALTTAVNLLRAVKRNRMREPRGRIWASTRLFPLGQDGGLPTEHRVLGMAVWDAEDEDAAPGALVRSAFADVRALLSRLGIRRTRTTDASVGALADGLPTPAWLHPGRCGILRADADDTRCLAVGGELAPAVQRNLGLPGRVALIEMSLDQILEGIQGRESAYTPVLRYPVVPFDVSLLVPRRTTAEHVAHTIESAVASHIRDVRLFDAYEGKGVPDGQRSLAFRLELFDRERTLTTKAADALRAQVIGALDAAGWVVRTK